jgi:hypothetical protein
MKPEIRHPSVLIPYPGPDSGEAAEDIFVYLRPEFNGVKVESTVLKVIGGTPEYKHGIDLIYLANLPGDFITTNRVIEEHYSLNLHFAKEGRAAFTTYMREAFDGYFNTPFEKARILGAFEALEVLDLTEDELFKLWVPARSLLKVHGQSIKKVENIFVVNYDIPALLHKNNKETDLAVMIFRSSLPYDFFNNLVDAMHRALIHENILKPGDPPSRVFHYSKGPFEQILDGIGYLYDKDGGHIPLEQLSFAAYLKQHGVSPDEIAGILKHPIMHFCSDDGSFFESNLYEYTRLDSYPTALAKYRQIDSQVII